MTTESDEDRLPFLTHMANRIEHLVLYISNLLDEFQELIKRRDDRS